MKTIVTQIIPTVQGEGCSIGNLILLIRLGNCNLECDFCDSKWSNNLKPSDYSIFKDSMLPPFVITNENFDEFLKYIKTFLTILGLQTILITGGEPFCHKEFLYKFIQKAPDEISNLKKIEIETNGTLIQTPDDVNILSNYYNPIPIQLNISPKLDPKYYRSKSIQNLSEIVSFFDKNINYSAILSNSIITCQFKLVHTQKTEDDVIQFANYFLKKYNQKFCLYIMPLTPQRAKYKSEINFLMAVKKNCTETLKFCFLNNYSFTPRIQVWLFDQLKKDEKFGL